uniref:RNA-dependent RNA polymerase n=1 Tax=Hubei blood fluke virus 3 TaxID=1922841 RepID=A0A1L3KNW5_9VIRU|nr:RNA-dependent RNA polymerase [Hubei blood fluke virus 3]
MLDYRLIVVDWFAGPVNYDHTLNAVDNFLTFTKKFEDGTYSSIQNDLSKVKLILPLDIRSLDVIYQKYKSLISALPIRRTRKYSFLHQLWLTESPFIDMTWREENDGLLISYRGKEQFKIPWFTGNGNLLYAAPGYIDLNLFEVAKWQLTFGHMICHPFPDSYQGCDENLLHDQRYIDSFCQAQRSKLRLFTGSNYYIESRTGEIDANVSGVTIMQHLTGLDILYISPRLSNLRRTFSINDDPGWLRLSMLLSDIPEEEIEINYPVWKDQEIEIEYFDDETHPRISILEGCGYVFKSLPLNVLRNWRAADIPEKYCITVGNKHVEIPLRTHVLKRLGQEAAEYGYKTVDAAMCLIDPNSYIWRMYSYLINRSDLRYISRQTTSGLRMKYCQERILAHKMLLVATNAEISRILLRNNKHVDLCHEILKEIFRVVVFDPIYMTARLKSPIGILCNFAFVIQKAGNPVLHWEQNLKRRMDTLQYGKWTQRREEAVSTIDYDTVDDACQSLVSYGLTNTAGALRNLISAPITFDNVYLYVFIRSLMALSGYSGSHQLTAAVDQIESHYGLPDPSQKFLDLIFNEAKAVATASPDTERTKDPRNRMRLLLSARNLRSAGLIEYQSYPLTVPIQQLRLRDVNGAKKYSVVKQDMKVTVRLNDKTSRILLLDDENMRITKPLHDMKVNAGSRQVVGGRLTRLVFPQPMPVYIGEIISMAHILDMCAKKPKGYMVGLFESFGAGCETGIPHWTLAFPLCITGQLRNTYMAEASDFSTFDCSQRELVKRAKLNGIREGLKKGSTLLSDSDCLLYMDRLAVFDKIQGLNDKDLSRKYVIPNEYGSVVVVHDSLLSGRLTTYLENTIVNQAFSTLLYETFVNRARPEIQSSIQPRFKHHMGDDQLDIYSADSFRNEDAYLLRDIISELAETNSMKISPKRLVVSTVATEHIKVKLAGGVLLPNDQIQLIAAEKSMTTLQSVSERLSAFFDLYMLKSTRSAEVMNFIPLYFQLWPMITRISAGDVRGYITPSIIFGPTSLGLIPSTPFVRGSVNLLLEVGGLKQRSAYWDEVTQILNRSEPISRYNTTLAHMYETIFPQSEVWKRVFTRKYGESPKVIPEDIKELTPEYGYKHLALTTLTNKMNKILQLESAAIVVGKLSKLTQINLKPISLIKLGIIRVSTTDKLIHRNLFKFTDSPYLTASPELLNLHALFGLCRKGSIEDFDPPTYIQRILSNEIGEGAPHLTGELLFKVLQGKSYNYIFRVLQLADFSESFIHKYIGEIYSKVNSFRALQMTTVASIYDSFTASIDLLPDRIFEFCDLNYVSGQVDHRAYVHLARKLIYNFSHNILRIIAVNDSYGYG